MNTLLSEPIHEDVTAAFGDATVRQYLGESEISCAYAICLDSGIAKIYRRPFPVNMDYGWEYLWTAGSATDVAIEYDGEWILDATNSWYYLLTEEFPYIFTVENGDLYVQYWRDSANRTLLASGVSQISACKGWQNCIDTDMDQGLIIGYLKDGVVYYRAFCTQEDGSKAWESEHQVTDLGTGNTTLSVIRTNDFRIGFLTENDGEMLLCLSKRNYAGMSVRPENIHANITAAFSLQNANFKNGYLSESLSGEFAYPFFNLDSTEESAEITVLSSEKLNREDAFTSYGCKLYLSKPISGQMKQTFADGASVTVTSGSTTSTVKVSSASYSANAITLLFASDIRRTNQLTVTTVVARSLSYERVQSQRWYLPAFSVTLDAEAERVDAYTSETVAAQISTAFNVSLVVIKGGCMSESVAATIATTFELAPVSTIPI